MGKRNHGKKKKNNKQEKETFPAKYPEEGEDKEKESITAKNPGVHTKNLNEEGEDRFSELPNSLILYILSLTINKGSCIGKLQTSKEVVKTCVLSKRWQFVWTGMSEIDLYESSKRIDKISRFVSLVGRVLDICRDLHRFSVGLFYDECFVPNLNSWVQIAVERNVKNISLTSYGDMEICYERPQNWYSRSSLTISSVICRMKGCYELPQILYSHSSLTTLSVSCLAMTPKEAIVWKSLKSLSITEVLLSDCIMEEIVSGCPVLEALRLKQCSGFTCLNIFSTTFTILEIEIRTHNKPTIDISAPYARELKIKYAADPKIQWYKRETEQLTQFRLRDITSLVRASLDFYEKATGLTTQIYMVELLQSLQYVKELDLSDRCIQYMHNNLSQVAGLNIPPSSRRHLTLNVWIDSSFHGFLRILKSFPYLETLIIKGFFFNNSESKELYENQGIKYIENNDLVFNHLKTINIALPRGHEVMALAKILLKSANVLQKMNLSYEPYNWEASQERTKAMIALPRSSPEAIVSVEYIPL